MIKVTETGIDQAIAKIRAISQSTSEQSKTAQIALANTIKNELIAHYSNTRAMWSEEAGTMAEISGKDVTIRKDREDYIVAIGESTPKVALSGYNGLPTQINPYLFVEYGFGIVGQNSPVSRAKKKGWKYNVKRHVTKWSFTANNGIQYYTMGVKGANGIGYVLSKKRTLINKALAQNSNNGEGNNV